MHEMTQRPATSRSKSVSSTSTYLHQVEADRINIPPVTLEHLFNRILNSTKDGGGDLTLGHIHPPPDCVTMRVTYKSLEQIWS